MKIRDSSKVFLGFIAALIVACAAPSLSPRPDPRALWAGAAAGPDPGCSAATLVSTGGVMPRDERTLAIRWTGFSNFELVYKQQIVLLDAYFDRGSMFPPLGFAAADVRRADLLLIGHGHVDHMADAASVGRQTGALVVGAPVTTEKLLTQAIDAKQVRTVHGRGGELLRFSHFTVEPVLGRHGEPPKDVTEGFQNVLHRFGKPPTAEQQKDRAAIRARGTSDPRVITEGTIGFLITLDNGFRIYYRDSGGVVTDYERAAMAKIPGVDVALVAVSASFLHSLTAQRAVEHMRAFKPEVFIPSHHDAENNGLWRATEPLFRAMKEVNPKLVTLSRGYREPICFDTANNLERGSRL